MQCSSSGFPSFLYYILDILFPILLDSVSYEFGAGAGVGVGVGVGVEPLHIDKFFANDTLSHNFFLFKNIVTAIATKIITITPMIIKDIILLTEKKKGLT
jgi:hypothetical protein